MAGTPTTSGDEWNTMSTISATSESPITVEHLYKTFRVPVREAGLRAALSGAFRRRYREVAAVLDKPVRTLSLGERMKCELVGALIHQPRVLFLDEPTLGLDVAMQQRLRRFVADHNRRSGATVLLTSHYMADVQALCPRVLI